MKLSNNFYRATISFTIAIAIIALPFLSFKKVEAQTVGYGATNYSTGGSLSGMIGDLSPLIKQLPGCTSALGTGDLFSGIKKLFKGKNDKVDKYTSTDSLGSEVEDITLTLEAVPVDTSALNKKIDTMTVEQKKQGEKLTNIDKSTETDTKNNQCLNSIGKAVIKMIIDKMTVSIVNWINTGNSGDSFFVKNPSQYFKDLAKEQLLAFQQEMADPQRFPFAKMYFTNVATGFNQTFQQNAQYSLNQVQGGWNTFTASANPANNPFGFALMASSEIQARIAGEAAMKTQELAQSGGFLGDTRCVDPEGVTKEEHLAALNGDIDSQSGYTSWDTGQGTYTGTARVCRQWETVTPGKTIAEELTSSMSDRKDALLDADTLNDAIAAILDAAIAKLSSTLTNEGLAAISMEDISTSYDTSNYDDNGLADWQSSQADRDFSDYQRDSSPWLQGHPDFNIRNDITEALIDEQRIYAEKLGELNYALMHDDSSTVSGKNGLIPTIYQLDYCIPGPHPGWEDDVETSLSKLVGELSSVDVTDSVKDHWWYELLDLLSLTMLRTVVDTVNGYAFNCGSSENANRAEMLGRALNNLTGIDTRQAIISTGNSNPKMCSVSGFNVIVQEIFRQYSNLINKYYNVRNLPSVAMESENKFNEISGYEQMIQDNSNAIAFQNGIVKRLRTLKAGVESLNSQFNNGQGTMTETTYEEELTVWKNSFARISSSLVSGGDIAHVYELANQAEEERLYILNDLIKGNAGCEKELKDKQAPMMEMLLNGMPMWRFARPDYPYPILYKFSATNNYDYSKAIDGVTPAAIVSLPVDGTQFNPSTGYTSAFLGDVVFTSNDELNPHLPGGNLAPWFSDVIELNGFVNEAIIQLNSPGFGGNAVYFEKALPIY